MGHGEAAAESVAEMLLGGAGIVGAEEEGEEKHGSGAEAEDDVDVDRGQGGRLHHETAVLRREFSERVYSPRDKEFQATVKKAIRMGQLPADTEVKVFLEIIFGPLTLRLLLRHERIDRQYVLRVFNRVVACAGAQQAKRRG